MTTPQPHIKRKDPRRSLDQVLKKLATLRSSITGTSLFAEENESAIDPGSRFIKIWHHVLLSCVLLQAFLVPYFIVFDPNAPIEMPVEVYVYLVCDFAFLLDFVVQAHTGYYYDGNLIRDVRKTRRRYLKSRAFLFDLVVIVPLSLLRIDLGSVPHAILEVHKVLRFLKIPRYIASLDDMYAKKFVAMKLLKMVVATVYLSHVVACLRFAFGYDLHHDNHWLPKVPSRRANSRGRYVMSLFWAFGLLSGFFEGELPHRIPEFVFGIFVAMCGFSLFTTLCATFFMISKCESGDSEAAEARINQLKHSLSFHRVPEDLQRKAIDYLRRYYTDVESNDREVMKLLCSSITKDIQIELLRDTTSSQAQKNHVEAHWIARRFLLRECIDADSPIRMIWIYALQAVLVYNWLVIPLDLCFPAFNRPLRYIKAANAVADTVLYVDIYLNLNLSFTLNSEKITDPSRSSIQYLRGSFAFDLLCAFPYSIFDSSTTNARLPRLLRATKLVGHYAEVDRFFHFTNRRRLVVLGLILVMLYHAVACLYFGITNIEGFSPLEEAWLPTNDVYLKKLNNTHYEDINRTIYLAEDHAVRKIAFTEYCRALYYAANVLTGLGKTIEPDSNVQYVAALFFMISGFLITGIVVDNVQKRFTASAYEHKQFYATRTRIQLFLRRQKAPIAIFQRVNSFLDFWWSCHRGAFINQLLADLPVSMRRDILKSIAGPAFQSLALLQGVRPVLEALEDFLVANMKFILYGQGEVVYRQGDYATGIFFLLEGEVCIITNAQNPRGIPLGSFFGTATLHHSESAEGYGEHVSATTGCILLFVSKDHLRAMEEIFPPIATELLHLESRLLRNKLAKTDVNNGGDRRSTTASLSRSSGLNVLANKNVVDAFDPDSPYVIMWETWLFIAMTVQWMTTVFQICFRMKKVRYIQGDIISFVLEASFVADVYIRSRLGYHAYGNKIMDLHVVRRTYFRSRTFVIDAVSLLPLNVVNFLRSPEHRLDVLNINKLLRLFKVPSQLHALENRYLKRTTELRLFKLVYYTLLLSHMFGCMYFDFASNSSRIFTSGLTEVGTEFGNDKWLPGKELESAPLNLQYFASLFWSFGLMSASNQDELPKTIHESIYSVITMTSGFFLFAYVVGNFTDIIELVDGDNREFNEKLASVRLLLWHFKLPKSIEDRVTTFYCFRRYHTITQERHLERFLPPSLLTDIRLVHLKPMIAKVSFLSGMEGSVTRMLVSQFTQVLALRDEFICKHGEEGYDMFFVFTGFLDVLIPVDKADSSTGVAEKKRDGSTATVLDPDDTQCCLLMKVNTLSSGSYFGENGLFTKSLRNASIRASTSCILYKLSRESLELVFDRYPLWKEKVLRIATLQREQARLAHLSAEEQKRSSDEAGGSMLSRLDILNQRAERLEEEMRFVHIKRLESTKEVVKESRWRKIEWFHSVRSTVRRLSNAMLQGSEAQSRVHLIWLRVTVLCTLYMCFVIPYRISIDPLMRSTFMATVIHILQLFCELFFIVDIFFSWNVHRGANAMELYEQSHRSMYVRERLFWDVVAALPIDHLLSDFVDNESLRLLRCAKIFNIIVYLGELSRRSVSYEINRFLSVCLLYTLAIYWCGCLYLAVSMKVGFGEEWQAWLPSKELEIEDPDDPSVKQVALRLLRGLFFGATAFLKKGRTFVPDRSSLYVFTIVVYFVGLLVMSFMLGEIVSLFISYIWNEVEFRKNHIAVELYLDRMKLSDGLKRRTHAFMSSLWSSHAGVHYQSIFEELPESIKSSCIKHIAQKPLRLFVSSIFRLLSVEGKDDLDLLTRSIAQSLKFEGYPRDEKVVTEGSISRAMYFVVKGCLSMESRSHSGIARVVIRKGDFFGDRGLLGCAVSAFTVNTVRACDLLALSSESLLMAINAHTFSGMALLLAQRAHLRLVGKPLKLCSRKDMEDQWGNALIAELRRMQHKPSRTGSRRISILKPLGEVLTQEAKEYLDDLNGIVTSPAEASRVFLSFLALVLPHDPLDGNAFSSLPVIGVTLEEPEESMDPLDGDTETKSHEPGPDTSTVPTTGSQDATPISDP
ncbi:hypothetical protein Poli38472_014192 [Pythium oligandrum]|uniref:Cyclic nucleotide-binding domain-containing protein n=1 Tax=Pythium oligandrum TaxID=41045 RepID=A0A8K1CIY2_PYTOL|nr:hypothetical protein Poli38472_014192 [Pythium oligandrum]|eukprot:TMW64075.1 hypothetical protein Poli38472_014192 [Pythium oligandrum]